MVGTFILAVVSSSFQALRCPMQHPGGAGQALALRASWGRICPGHLGLLLDPRDALQPPLTLKLPPPPGPRCQDCLASGARGPRTPCPQVPVVYYRLLCPHPR